MSSRNFPRHPTKDIIETKSRCLSGKRICLCISSSVAIMNAPHLARELMRHGAEVYPVMTPKAMELITPTLFQWSTGNQVITEITGEIEHVFMAGEHPNDNGFVDAVVVFPATANTIGKITHGIADNAVTAICMVALGSRVPLIIVPAMHHSMFNNPNIQHNLKLLENQNVSILGPRIEENKAKIANIDDVSLYILGKFQKNPDFQNKRILITYGATREYIDDVRYITNSASGKTGKYLAEIASQRGAKVTVFRSPSSIEAPVGVNTIVYQSTQDCAEKIYQHLETNTYDVIISTAAFADFTPNKKENHKISSNNVELSIKLVSTPKILDIIKKNTTNTFIVAFKAETTLSREELIDKGKIFIKQKLIDMIIVNNIHPTKTDRGIGFEQNEVIIIDKDGNMYETGLQPKEIISEIILNKIIEKI